MQQWASNYPFLRIAATLSIGILFLALLVPVVDLWEDQWRMAVAGTRMGGACAVDMTIAGCESKIEPWKIVPWIFVVGYCMIVLALCWPTTYQDYLRPKEDA